MSRQSDLARFYRILDRIETRTGGRQLLENLAPARMWPPRGVYFFFEPGEMRTGSGQGERLVRIGTHALTAGARSTLHQRLRQHAGNSSGRGGNHRGSIFRLLVGEALAARGDELQCPSWGKKSDLGKAAEALSMSKEELAAGEAPLEFAVSRYLGRLPFTWLAIDDEPGPGSLRGYVEQNAIALTSCLHDPVIDPPSPSWLGLHSGRDSVRRSGLWNQRHVGENCDPGFLDGLEAIVERLPAGPRERAYQRVKRTS